jgi:hypothetical protein
MRLLSTVLILIITHAGSSAFGCESTDLALLFEKLKPVGSLYHCNFEVASRDDSKGNRKYMMWVQDKNPDGDQGRHTATFELVVPKPCLDSQPGPPHPIQNSFGFDVAGIRYRTALSIQINPSGLPRSLLIQELNLSSGLISKRVNCTSGEIE